MFIVSALRLSVEEPYGVTVSSAEGEKCQRCWNHRTDVGADAEHPEICGRCDEVVRGLEAR
jgi:isoleucyl-tRNA synthetase